MMTRKNLWYLLSGLSFFFLFLLFSYLVQKNLFTQIDFDTTVRLQDTISRRFDPIFSWLSIIGNFEVLTIVLVVLLVVLRKILAGIMLFGSFVLFHIIEILGKTFIHHPPPPQFLLRTEHPFDFPQFHVRSEFAYPSGHSGRTIFISVILLYIIWQSKRLSRTFKILITLGVGGFNFFMLLSRPYLGEHWLSDVIGGTLLALAMSLLGLSFVLYKPLRIIKRNT